MCGRTHDVVIYSKLHQYPFKDFGATWIKSWPFLLLWLLAFTTGCTPKEAAITICSGYIDDVRQFTKTRHPTNWMRLQLLIPRSQQYQQRYLNTLVTSMFMLN